MNGKGDKRRPMQISRKEFEKKWDDLFGIKEEKPKREEKKKKYPQ
jgi:hypothetical protein